MYFFTCVVCMKFGNQDWHKSKIILALKQKGTSLAFESRKAGYMSNTLANALTRPWTKGEQIIASALDIPPEQIWPSRYLNKVRTTRAKIKKEA